MQKTVQDKNLFKYRYMKIQIYDFIEFLINDFVRKSWVGE